MKISYPFFLFVFLVFIVSQNDLCAQNEDDLEEIQYKQYKIAKKSLEGLFLYSSANMVTGLIGRQNNQGSQRYFHEMNFAFNTVNFAISSVGYFTLMHPVFKSRTEVLNDQIRLEGVYKFNAALDVFYVLGGLNLITKSRKTTGDSKNRMQGYGQSIILQGSFLFLYDLFLYHLHHRNTKRLENLTFGITSNGIGFSLTI